MSYTLQELLTRPYFRFFHDISAIPRCSGHEQAISGYLVAFAQARNLEVIQDAALNVIIKKAATAGCQHQPVVIIQGHMDMVCEQNADNDHDFAHDPLALRVIDDQLYATDTTLGADNGVAVAYALALLDSQELAHPALEVVITTAEETTMHGALSVDPFLLNGRILINIDSEVSHELLVGGAGGIQFQHELDLQRQPAGPENCTDCYCLQVHGLRGGHSGIEIDKERANAIKLLGRLLDDAQQQLPLAIQAVQGGTNPNAIPRESRADIHCPTVSQKRLADWLAGWQAQLRYEYQDSEPNLTLSLTTGDTGYSAPISPASQQALIQALLLYPNGIQHMSTAMPGLVETSLNIGVLATNQDTLTLQADARSSTTSRKDMLTRQAQALADLLGARLKLSSDYPAWPINPDSAIRRLFETTYQQMTGRNITANAVHAGIESGIFIDKIPGLDAIALGPDIHGAHTPQEHVDIPSMIFTWDLLTRVLANMDSYAS